MQRTSYSLLFFLAPFVFAAAVCLPSTLRSAEWDGLSPTVLGRSVGQSSENLPPLRLNDPSPQEKSAHPLLMALSSENKAVYRPESWSWQLFPNELMFPAFLAGVHETRLSSIWNWDRDQNRMWDSTLGGRVPFLRYGNKTPLQPRGWQLDIEGAVHLRLDPEHTTDMDANDFRFGFPISYGTDTQQIRFGYYHVSSHLGDERMMRLNEMGVPHSRINYYREALIFGYAYKPCPDIRLYFEADFAVKAGECTKRWHFQFGTEYSPRIRPGDSHGSPFAAINVRLMEERHFDGNLTAQLGWQWRGNRNQLFRFGAQYFAGISEQYEHINGPREHKVGIGFWYDF